MNKTVLITILLFGCVVKSLAQTAGKTLSPFLRDCYSEPNLLDRNNLPPMTLSVLLDIIRKIEDHPNAVGDIRQISTAIMHMFRQDGIVYDPTAIVQQFVVPYSATGFPIYKNMLLLNKLLPGNQFNLPTDSLTPEEKCALHFMVSTSILLNARGDEEWTCKSISLPGNRSGRLAAYREADDIEIIDVNGIKDHFGRQILGTTNCPIETGVVSTPWGDVAMGPVIAGISAGLEEQNVLVSDLVTLKSGFTDSSIVVNNRYAATVAGDIAETAIRQGMTRNSITVGGTGGWNSSYANRHYFHTRTTDLELTDAEIRGGLDGLILSELGLSNVNAFPELRLSQLIDMYYTSNGIMHEPRFRACNRIVLIPDIAPSTTLIERSLGPAIALYHASSLSGTTNIRGIEQFVNNTVIAFHSYIPLNMNSDPLCPVSVSQMIRPKVNLILITSEINRNLISYIVDNIEVGKHGSSIALLHPETGEVIIDKTFSAAKFYTDFALRYRAQIGTLDVVKSLNSIRELMTTQAATEMSLQYSGGNATVALFLSDTIPLTGNDWNQAMNHVIWLRRFAPDLRLVFASSSSGSETVAPLLRSRSDFIPVTLSSARESPEILSSLLENIRTSQRRIVNPLCSTDWNDRNSGTIGFEDYVDANGINLYRIIPNYYFVSNPLRMLRIQTQDSTSLSVCYSRTDSFPRRNQTTGSVPGDVTCQSATSASAVEISLAEACHQATSVESCPPFYLTVASATVPLTPQCKGSGCRYPNDIKYLVAAHELGCYSNAIANKINLGIFVLIYVLVHTLI
ncbi:uncharacterized protein LOC134680017 [Cydia fagiglandana]|uniref:uncharacterized protein LOC134680017 n=1 Tax=Cydia fagiglandana TaxID=1458189 RepID=UPI002FEE05EF